MKFGWRGAVGLLISAVAIWWLAERSGISWPDAWRLIKGANVPLLITAAAVGTLMFPLRAVRWGVILEPVAPNVPFAQRWRATAIGMMGNNITPRGGEFARAFVLTTEAPEVPFSTALGSIFVDRAFDAFVVLLLLVVAIFEPGFPREAKLGATTAGTYALGLAGLVGLVAIGLYALVFFPDRLIAIWRFGSRPLPLRVRDLGELMLRRFGDGLAVLRDPARFLRVVGWTLIHWLVQALAFWIGFQAIGVHASFYAALFVQAAIAFAVVIPSSPGFIGVFEKSAAAALTVYGVDRSAAAAWAIAYHAVSLIPITFIGLYYVWKLNLTIGQIGGGAANAS